MTDRLTSGYVVLLGRPNAGKSSLLNRLLKEKVSIVSAIPQTTRNTIIGIRHLPAARQPIGQDQPGRPGAQLIFLDTPGLNRPQRRRLNQRMLQRTRAAVEEADVILYVVDASRRPGPGADVIEDDALALVTAAQQPCLLLLNKIDLIRKSRLLPLIEQCRRRHAFDLYLPVSAETGDGLEALLEAVAERLPEGVPYYPVDQTSDQPLPFRIAELIRERVLRHTRQEVPHAVAVVVEGITEPARAGRPVHVDARIVVDRESQKGILIGKGGRMLKTVGTEARGAVELLLNRPVFLSLRVAVAPQWREDEQFLNDIGY
jgi:GTPase